MGAKRPSKGGVNNKFWVVAKTEIYPSQLTIDKANKSDHLADCLDLTFIIASGGKLLIRLYDKRDDFDFHIFNVRGSKMSLIPYKISPSWEQRFLR